MNKKITSALFLTIALTATAVFAQTEPTPSYYEKIASTSSTFPSDIKNGNANVIDVSVEVPIDRAGGWPYYPKSGVIVTDPLAINLSQKINSITVYYKTPLMGPCNTAYSYLTGGGGYYWHYFSLNTDKLDTSILTRFLNNSFSEHYTERDTSSFVPKKEGMTTLNYVFNQTIVQIPVIVQGDATAAEPQATTEPVNLDPTTSEETVVQ